MVPTLLHLHIPKCAGIGIKNFLADQYAGRRFYTFAGDEQFDEDIKDGGRAADAMMISGHFRWGLHARLERPCMYFVLLRDPVKRVISLANFIRHNPDHRMHGLLNEPGMTIEKLLGEHLEEGAQFSNGMVKQLSGLDEADDKRHFDTSLVNLLSPYCISGALESLPVALDNLRDRFIIGYGLPDRETNVATAEWPVSEADLKAIRDHNSWDLKLYSLVRAAARIAEPRRTSRSET